jgi:hypothetical protein
MSPTRSGISRHLDRSSASAFSAPPKEPTGSVRDIFGTRERSANQLQQAKNPHGAGFQRADDRVRTGDPQLGKLMLYQLSYVRAQVILPGDVENLRYRHTSRTKRRAARPDRR